MLFINMGKFISKYKNTTVLTFSNPLFFNRSAQVGPIPAISETSFSPIGSATKFACFFEVDDMFFYYCEIRFGSIKKLNLIFFGKFVAVVNCRKVFLGNKISLERKKEEKERKIKDIFDGQFCSQHRKSLFLKSTLVKMSAKKPKSIHQSKL